VRQATQRPDELWQNGVAARAAHPVASSSPHEPQTPEWHEVPAGQIEVLSSWHLVTQRFATQVSVVAQFWINTHATQRCSTGSQCGAPASVHWPSLTQATQVREPVTSQCRPDRPHSASPAQVVPLAVLAARTNVLERGAARTRFQMYKERLHYVPHTYAGIAVSLLFLGRLVYRLVQAYTDHAARLANATDPSQAPASMLRSPLTVGILFVLVGYYVYYYSWLLWKSKRLDAVDIEAQSAAAAP